MIAVANRGDEAASAITVRAFVTREGEAETSRDVTFDYLAGHGVRRGAFVVAGGLSSPADIRLEVLGFVEP